MPLRKKRRDGSRPASNETSLEGLAAHYGARWSNGSGIDDRGAPVDALRAQAHRGFRLLRFSPALERRFRSHLRQTGRVSRLIMLMLGVPALASEPLVDRMWLAVPAPLMSLMMRLDWFVILPLLVISAVVVIWRNKSPLSDWMLIGALFGVAGSVLVQRVVGVRYGFNVPVEMASAPLLAVLTLGRIPFRRMLGVSVAFLLGLALVELRLTPAPPSSHFHLYTVIVLVAIGLCAGYSLEYFMRWSWLNSSLLRYMARYDGLTGLLNRPALEEKIEQAHEQACRHGRPYVVALIDIDRFGEYNDHYGHQAGDAVLRKVGGILSARTVQPADVCGRYGGEEFLVFWADASSETGRARAQDVRERIAAQGFRAAPDSEYAVVTASVGLCEVDPNVARGAVKQAIACADRMLYAAKADGRDCTRAMRFSE